MNKLFFVICFALVANLPIAPTARATRCDATVIIFPRDGESVGGTVVITGRADLAPSFARFALDFSTAKQDRWTQLNSLPLAIPAEGVLARWNTTTVPEGAYELRLRAIDASGNYCEHLIAVRVQQNAARAQNNPALIRVPMLRQTLEVAIPRAPSIAPCTHFWELGVVVTRSVKLCAGEIYGAFVVYGDNIAVVGDETNKPIVGAGDGGFAITVHGNNNFISGVHLLSYTERATDWLCLYDECYFNTRLHQGGVKYGGGILLLNGANATVLNSSAAGGVIGIALINRRGDRIIGNTLRDLSGWGIFAQNAADSFWLENSFARINRACTGPDGNFYSAGCETGGIVCLACNANVIAFNRCEATSNCYYLQGEGAFASNSNKFYGNRCSAPTHNCFEFSYAQENEMDYNVAELRQGVTEGCALWLVYSRVILGTTNQFAPCHHRGSRLESSVEYVAGKP